jgi:hypothetical protein
MNLGGQGYGIILPADGTILHFYRLGKLFWCHSDYLLRLSK